MARTASGVRDGARCGIGNSTQKKLVIAYINNLLLFLFTAVSRYHDLTTCLSFKLETRGNGES
jgi:hypothetical protein